MLRGLSLNLRSLSCHLRCGRATKNQSWLSLVYCLHHGRTTSHRQPSVVTSHFYAPPCLDQHRKSISSAIWRGTVFRIVQHIDTSHWESIPERLSQLSYVGMMTIRTKAWPPIVLTICVRDYMAYLSNISYISDREWAPIAWRSVRNWKQRRKKVTVDSDLVHSKSLLMCLVRTERRNIRSRKAKKEEPTRKANWWRPKRNGRHVGGKRGKGEIRGRRRRSNRRFLNPNNGLFFNPRVFLTFISSRD